MTIVFHSLVIVFDWCQNITIHTHAIRLCTYDRWYMNTSQSNKYVATKITITSRTNQNKLMTKL